MKKAISLFLALMLLFALGVPALAEDGYAPFQLHSHYWKAYVNGYIGLYTFSAAKVTPEGADSFTVRLQPGSTITVENDGSGLTGPDADAILTAYTDAGGEFWLPLKAGTYTAETLFGVLDLPSYTEVTDGMFRPGSGEVGPFASLYLAEATMDASSRVVTKEYRIFLDAPAGPVVVRSPQNLSVDGAKKDVEKYNIDGSNYFKLRDIAYLLNGTGSRFSVGWDAETGTVSIVTGEAYEPNGSEMIVGSDKSATAVPSAQTIRINGVVRTDLSVFNLDGNNFFKLRDLGEALGFDVDYDPDTNTAIIQSR